MTWKQEVILLNVILSVRKWTLRTVSHLLHLLSVLVQDFIWAHTLCGLGLSSCGWTFFTCLIPPLMIDLCWQARFSCALTVLYLHSTPSGSWSSQQSCWFFFCRAEPTWLRCICRRKSSVVSASFQARRIPAWERPAFLWSVASVSALML